MQFVEHPYFAVRGADGKFDIKNLPLGEYTIEAWHEKLGTAAQRVHVAPAEAKTVNLVLKANKPCAFFGYLLACPLAFGSLRSIASTALRNSVGFSDFDKTWLTPAL